MKLAEWEPQILKQCLEKLMQRFLNANIFEIFFKLFVGPKPKFKRSDCKIVTKHAERSFNEPTTSLTILALLRFIFLSMAN